MEADARERVRAEEEAIALKTALAIANEWNLTPLAAEEASTVATHLEQSSRAWDRWKQDPSNTRELGKSQRLGVQVRDLKQVALRRALAKGLSFRCTRVLGPTDYEAARARGIEPEPFMGHGIEGITLIPLAGEPDLALALNALKARVAASPNPEKRQ